MRTFSTPAITFTVSNIDDEHGILSRVIVASAGKVKSYAEVIDMITLHQIAQLGNAKSKGVKARFGHPNMCSSAFGTYIGRFKNFQVENFSVFADLHLDPICKDSPSGNLYDYILRMARTNPDMFGASIAFVPSAPQVTDDEFPSTRVSELLATDLVDDPAATNSLFSADSFAYQATLFLDNNPAITQLIAAKPDILLEFMLKYFSKNDHMKTEMFQKLRSLFKGSDNPTAETAAGEVNRIEKHFDEMSVRIGETYAGILDKVRNNPVQVKQFENAGPLPASAESIFGQIVIPDNLTLENMFDDASLIVNGLLTQSQELATYYNTAIENLIQDHQKELSKVQDLATINQQLASSLQEQVTSNQQLITSLQEQATSYQQQLASSQDQISTLQDQLKARPTMVDSLDPQLKVGTTEDSFGKRLLTQMPKELKEKIRKRMTTP